MPYRTRHAAALSLASAIALAIPAANAQNAAHTPSEQQIINALKPSGILSNTTRGIRPLPPGPPAAGTTAGIAPGIKAPSASTTASSAAPGAFAPSAAAPGRQTAPSVSLNVDFANNSAQLTPEAKQSLGQLGQALTSKTLTQYRFKIVGHTDTVGSAAANKALSDARAKAVKAYLQRKYNIQPARLDAVGVGESGLLVPTPPQTPNAENRRVQVINLGH